MTAGGEDGNGADAVITVALAIDHGELADRIRRLLSGDRGIEITAEGAGQADLWITDSTADLKAGARAIVLAAGPEAADALRSGAAAILSIRTGPAELAAAIRAVAQGLTVVAGAFRDQFLPRDFDSLAVAEDETLAVDLTGRELQVLALLSEGASNKVIARALGVTPHTAKFHVASIMSKLGASGRTDAVAKAMRMGIVMF